MNSWKSKLNKVTLPPLENLPMQRLNHIDHQYFNEINNEYKAYILGFIYADGYIVDGKNGRQSSLRVAIQYGDGYILEKLIQDVCERSIVKKHAPAMIKKGEQPQAVISISSEEICNTLRAYGCAANKSMYGIQFPDISEELYSHFIRGFFDGNGSISVDIEKNRYVRKTTHVVKNAYSEKLRKRICFVSTDKEFLRDLLVKTSIDFLGKFQWRAVTKTLTAYKLSIEVKADVESFKSYLYKDATVYLKRKYDKFNMTIKSQAETTVSEGVETT